MSKKKSLLSQLFGFAGNFKYLTLLGMLLSGISVVVSLMPIIYVWLGVKEIFKVYPNITMTETLAHNAYMAVITAILAMVIYFFSLMCTHIAAFRIAKNMRLSAMKHLMDLPLGFFSENGSGKLRRIISDSASQTETFLAHQLPDLVGAFMTPIAVIVFLFIFDWRLGLISLAPIILAFLSMSFTPNRTEEVKKHQTALEKMNNEAVEYVRGIPVVKTFGQSIFSFEKFHKTIIEYKELTMSITRMLRMPMTFYQTFLGSTAIFLTISGILLFAGASNPKNFLLNFLFYLFFTPICGVMMMKIMWTSQFITLAQDAVNRVNELLEEKPLPEKANTKKPSKYDISLEGVSFSYTNTDVKAVDGVSMSIKQGSTVALVGPSGGGKSTLAMLVARFFDVNEGSIKIGGIDVRDMSEDDLMKNISFVFQHTNLYKSSILDNLKEGKPDATEKEIITALKTARCMDIIEKLPGGINTIVGTKGVFLSGGEAQRIAIARSILKDAPIILLDEATAFTDPENEHEIQLAFNELTKGKTVLMIAHRLSTVQNADCIFVVSEGKIKEQGTHGKLISKKGIYEDMWNEYQTAFIWNESEVLA